MGLSSFLGSRRRSERGPGDDERDCRGERQEDERDDREHRQPVAPLRARIGGVLVSPQTISVVVVAGVLFILLHLFLNQTRLGRMMQAVAQDREAARLMGIHVDQIIALTFVLNSMLAGVAGLLLAPIFLVTTDMGSSILVKAFSASIIGGFGSVPGAIVGGIILGVVEALAAVYISSVFKDGVAFLALILALLLAPGGLFAEKIGERV